jgi:hypothetical protein
MRLARMACTAALCEAEWALARAFASVFVLAFALLFESAFDLATGELAAGAASAIRPAAPVRRRAR